jgi:TonB family protein
MMRLSLFCLTALALGGCVQSPASDRTTAAATAAQAQPALSQQPSVAQDCTPPAFPAGAQQARMSGVSMMAFLVGSDGAVRETRLLKSSGYAVLDEAAQAALKLCRFRPTLKDGQAVAAWQPVQYVWAP